MWIISASAFIGYVWMIGSHKMVNQDYFQMFSYVVEGTKVRKVRNDLFTTYSLLCKLQYLTVPAGLLIPPLLVFNIGLMVMSRLFSFLRPIRDFVKDFRHYSYNLTNEGHMFAEVNHRYANVDDLFEVLLLVGTNMMLLYLASQTSVVGVAVKTLFPGFVKSLTRKPVVSEAKQAPPAPAATEQAPNPQQHSSKKKKNKQ